MGSPRHWWRQAVHWKLRCPSRRNGGSPVDETKAARYDGHRLTPEQVRSLFTGVMRIYESLAKENNDDR